LNAYLGLDIIDGGGGSGSIMGRLNGFIHTRGAELSWASLAEQRDDDQVDREHQQVAGNADEDLKNKILCI
jgi:hypothetical protein